MKKFFMLFLLSFSVLSCSIFQSNKQQIPSESNYGPTREEISSLPTTSQQNIPIEGRVEWSILYNPPHTRIMDMYLNFMYTDRHVIPLIKTELNDTSMDFKVFLSKSYYFDENYIYIPSNLQKVSAFDKRTGNLKWESDLVGNVIGLSKKLVLVYRDDNRIYSLEKETGGEKWKIILNSLVADGDTIYPFPNTLITEDDIVIPIERSSCSKDYTGERTLSFLHMDEESGTYYLTDCIPEFEDTDPFLYINGMVISRSDGNFTGHGPRFYGVDIQDGSVVWSFGGEYDSLDPINLDTNKKILYVKNRDNFSFGEDVIALDIRTGKMVWNGTMAELNGIKSRSSKYEFNGEGEFSFRGEFIIYTNLDDHELLVFQASDGHLVNTIKSDRSFNVSLAENGAVFYYKDLGILAGVDYLTGNELWSNDESNGFLPFYKRTFGNVVLAASDGDYNLVFLDQRTGNILWSGSLSEEEPFAYYDGNIIYIENKNLSFINSITGSKQDIYIGDNGSMVNNGGFIEVIDNSMWLLCGDYLTMVSIH